MDKKICIIHFNTPVLTHCLVRSINKYTPGATIYIFDNSDKKPFVNTFDNVIVFDNTKGELVNFNEVLKKFPLRTKSRGKTNNYGSAKHSMSIQKCVEVIDDNFVLLDSDVLLKRDITPIFNTSYVWVAGVEEWTNKTLVGATKRKRVCPFLMFMNVVKMKELGIRFYDDEHMLGFNNGPKCEEYETGVWFYEATPKQYRRIINYNDYIRHFRAGSWLEDARTKHKYKQMDPVRWLEIHQKLWLKNGEKLTPNWSKKIVLANENVNESKKAELPKFSQFFDHIYCLHYLPSYDRYQKIKDEFEKVGIDENAKYFSWVYDYPSPLIDLVYNDGRVNMNSALKSTSRSYIKRVSMKHYEIIKEAYLLGYDRILILENDIRFHNDIEYINTLLNNMPDSDIIMLFFIFCSCYSLNRTGMEHIIAAQEKNLLPPDTPLNDKTLTGSFAIINLAIQDPALKTRKDETYNKIGLDTGLYTEEDKNNVIVASAVKKPLEIKPPQKHIMKPPQIKHKDSSSVVFRMPTKPQVKKKIEAVPAHKPETEKVTIVASKPIVTRSQTILKKKKIAHTRVITAKASGFNRLYD